MNVSGLTIITRTFIGPTVKSALICPTNQWIWIKTIKMSDSLPCRFESTYPASLKRDEQCVLLEKLYVHRKQYPKKGSYILGPYLFQAKYVATLSGNILNVSYQNLYNVHIALTSVIMKYDSSKNLTKYLSLIMASENWMSNIIIECNYHRTIYVMIGLIWFSCTRVKDQKVKKYWRWSHMMQLCGIFL